MRRTARTTLHAVLLAAALAVTAAPAMAEELDKGTADSLQGIITQQLDAFAKGDEDKAASFASPGIQQRFPGGKDFMAMVHQSYEALVKPRSTRFDKAGSTALGPMQSVALVDKDGTSWMAVYTFEQVDGQWKINGCVLVKQEGTSV